MTSQQQQPKRYNNLSSFPSGNVFLPCNHHKRGRNLVVCIDGTGNQFGAKNTNVIELYNLILKEDPHDQQTWYNSGIGTYARPSWKAFKFYRQALYHKLDLAIAWNFERTILSAYQWLSDNYKEGDCIFLFGFSRGAYQVRVLSAMIDKVGLIHKGNELQIPFAYELYADPMSGDCKGTEVGQVESQGEMSMADRFKNAFSHKDVKVHFVGAWDTVSSVGIIRGKTMLPGTVEGMKHVCYFRHALALDERRVKFLPEYAYGGATLPREEDNHDTSATDEKADQTQDMMKPTIQLQQTMEVWFAGTHSDIGGGNAENAGMDRRKPPLRWMVFEAGGVGLRTAPLGGGFLDDAKIEIRESLRGLWWILEVLPIRRLTFTRREDGKHVTTRKPHLGSSRKIHPGQKFHSSLLADDDASTSYTPKARPIDDDFMFWTKLRSAGFNGEWLEVDSNRATMNLLVDYGRYKRKAATESLYKIATSSSGQQLIYQKTIEVLNPDHPGLVPEACHDVLTFSMKLFGTNPRRACSVKVRASLSRVLVNPKYQKTAQEFLVKFTDPCIHTLHGIMPWSIASSQDGTRIVLVSSERTFRVCDVETGELVGEYGKNIRSAACSRSSGGQPLVVSGSYDGPVQIWDMLTGEPKGKPLRGHKWKVISVAFSSDDRRIVSGSLDLTVRIWDVDSREQLQQLEIESRPSSVAISSDGKIVCQGSDGILIWDTKTGEKKEIQGHTERVYSVSLSPDDKFIASASGDGTVRIWNVETGEEEGEPYNKHDDEVNSAAFSPSGDLVVSGGDDQKVRIWDMKTRESIGVPFEGHSDVCRVAFCGNHIVSCLRDKTVRIWDAEIVKYKL